MQIILLKKVSHEGFYFDLRFFSELILKRLMMQK
jgi:hypothetical protein